MKGQPWPEDRRNELESLIRLVDLAAGINRGSGVMQTLESIITQAEAAQAVDYTDPRCSFIQFLIDQATGDA